jgi:hypothetical protein
VFLVEYLLVEGLGVGDGTGNVGVTVNLVGTSDGLELVDGQRARSQSRVTW